MMPWRATLVAHGGEVRSSGAALPLAMPWPFTGSAAKIPLNPYPGKHILTRSGITWEWNRETLSCKSGVLLGLLAGVHRFLVADVVCCRVVRCAVLVRKGGSRELLCHHHRRGVFRQRVGGGHGRYRRWLRLGELNSPDNSCRDVSIITIQRYWKG